MNNCTECDGEGNIWNNADPTSGQRFDCEACQHRADLDECHQALKNIQTKLAEWIAPDSGISDDQIINDILGIADTQTLFRTQARITAREAQS